VKGQTPLCSVIGNGGCNAFNGNYTQDGANVQIGPLAATRKACPPDIMNMEMALLNALSNAKTIEATHLNLTLLGENGVQLMSLQRQDFD
jgi:heat shock protein HslJ